MYRQFFSFCDDPSSKWAILPPSDLLILIDFLFWLSKIKSVEIICLYIVFTLFKLSEIKANYVDQVSLELEQVMQTLPIRIID